MKHLKIQGVTKRFTSRNGDLTALENVTLEIHPGEFLVLVGASGCGKSTLLNLVAGLDTPDEGFILMDGVKIKGAGPDRAVVFQDGALFPWLTVLKNVEFGLKRLGVAGRDRHSRAMHYLGLVGLEKFADSFIHELSGGMRQRVAIARALAVEPQVLLMDEPFSALDAQTREDLYGELQDIWERLGTTVIFVTHNVREAVTLGDRVVVLTSRPGRIVEIFPINIIRPRHIDDTDVAHTARKISLTMRHSRTLTSEELQNNEFDPKDRLLRDTPDSMGIGSSPRVVG